MSKESIFRSDINDPIALEKEFFERFPFYSEDSKKQISKAWHLLVEKTKEKLRPCGVPYYLHQMRVAFFLAENEFDSDCICAGILHNCQDLQISSQEIEKDFGKAVWNIINGAAKIRNFSVNSKTLLQADAIRKMLFAMSDDVRIIFLKMADRLDKIRHIRNETPQKQREIASEVIDIWAPLADRLGMQSTKNEFEDLSLKYSNPDAFQQIKAVISQKKEERSEYLKNAVEKIQNEAQKAGLKTNIESRAKHFYSIYQKMRKRNKEPGELFDLLALRIICEKKSECYTLIGIVHSLWKPLDGRFKDYIAMPKSNGYQSLHTTVMCEDRPLEIQIRTQKMHDIAEHGVASHWLYKKGLNHDLVNIKNLSIFNQLQELGTKQISNEHLFQEFKNDLLGDEIFVFTPKGEVIQLPAGSTAIDFAYKIHSAIGEKIIGAKADGKIIPLIQPLKNTQIIEIITNPQAHPTENQLKAVHTAKARSKINAWLAANDPKFVDTAANQRLEDSEAEHTHYKRPSNEKRSHKKSEGFAGTLPKGTGKVRVENSANFLVNFAKCCKPEYPEPIVGYVSRSKGIMIHRAICWTFKRIPNIENRTIEVRWETEDDLKKK